MRLPRLRVAGMPFHIIQRGNNRSACFVSDVDRSRFLGELRTSADWAGVAIHAYVLMTNHVHLLATPATEDGLGAMMKSLGERYVPWFNRRHQRTGTLWEGRFRSCLIDSDGYLLTCHRYIECNPVRAGMVRRPEDYVWSSHRANAYGRPDAVVTPHSLYLSLGTTAASRCTEYRYLFTSELPQDTLDLFRTSIVRRQALWAPPS